MAPIREIMMDDLEEEEEVEQELRVTFYPELHLQRRIWVLNILRRENTTRALDIGCGEGELLGSLCQPAPWLTPPPDSILPIETPKSPITSPTFNSDDDVPNLHATHIHGLDVSESDISFAIDCTRPPRVEGDLDPESPHPFRRYSTTLTRFEDLEVKLWKGGFEVINEEFAGIECIVSTEVIEHLPQQTLPLYAPVILGVYHPKTFLMTTPSYTFNARFTSPTAPTSVRKGYPDPTKRTDRVFRHSDHKFEWTTEEFQSWCDQTAQTWGYSVHWTSIGRALDPDPYGRDEELGGASFVAEFRKLHDDVMTDAQRDKLGRETVQSLLSAANDPEINTAPHVLVASHHHTAHPSSRRPQPLDEIARVVKSKMEEYREAFMRLDELWFESEISTACGGWIEFLVKAIEESSDLLLKKEGEGVKRKRDLWTVEIIGAAARSRNLWGDTDAEIDQSTDSIPPGWTPGEGSLEVTDCSDIGESTGAEGDISLCNSEDDDGESAWSPKIVTGKGWPPRKPKRRSTWQSGTSSKYSEDHEDSDDTWGDQWVSHEGWGESSGEERGKEYKRPAHSSGAAAGLKKEKEDGNNSTAGWDGDADDSDTE